MRSGTSVARRVIGRSFAFNKNLTFNGEVEARLQDAGAQWEEQPRLPNGDNLRFLTLRGEVVGKLIVHMNGHYFYDSYWVGDDSFEWVGSPEHRASYSEF